MWAVFRCTSETCMGTPRRVLFLVWVGGKKEAWFLEVVGCGGSGGSGDARPGKGREVFVCVLRTDGYSEWLDYDAHLYTDLAQWGRTGSISRGYPD